MQEGSVIIAGFGRSGTTWLSDILSKVLGGLILFEPFHPCIFSNAEAYCYNTNILNTTELKQHLNQCHNNPPINNWLLRNHLPSDPSQISTSYINYIWRNSKIIGFKTLRLNHSLNRLNQLTGSKIIYIIRNPFAVLCSINNRPNFWEEFGWEWHKKYFFFKTLTNSYFDEKRKSELVSLARDVTSDDEYIILMWCISFVISFNEIRLCRGHLACYEDLYLDPYLEISNVLNFIDPQEKHALHPSYFFTPSMTSLSTIHHGSELEHLSKEHLDSIFWKNKLDSNSIIKLKSVITKALAVDDAAMQFLHNRGYLS